MQQITPLIVETAQALGMNPVDLATIISYETGGTFNPTQAGPTTQWGQHRGLIQFGEPQAREYGVDWNNPLNSQLGADGAVARYFKANGYKPGMGLLDAYSIVNAGAPGRYNASDANSGGAPGTVADKVNEQMAAHRARAERMLGGIPVNMGQEEKQAGILASLLGTTDEALTGMGEAAYAMSQPKTPQWLERPQAAPYQPQRRDPMAAYRQLFQRLRA